MGGRRNSGSNGDAGMRQTMKSVAGLRGGREGQEWGGEAGVPSRGAWKVERSLEEKQTEHQPEF